MDVAMFLLLVLMLISASSMFDLHVVVLFYVMFNILELIMEIVPNYPTDCVYHLACQCVLLCLYRGQPVRESRPSSLYIVTTAMVNQYRPRD